MPNDGGFLSSFTEEEKNDIVKRYPLSEKMFKRILGAEEFIKNKARYCLWLLNIEPKEIISVPPIVDAISHVKEMREQSKRPETKKLAEVPMLFGEIRQPETDYLIVPLHTGGTRKYIPIGFETSDVIATNACSIIKDANLYIFGILMSNVHNAWMRVTAGYLGTSYRYSSGIVYNNFPWPTPTNEQKKKIEMTAQMILDARAKYPNSSLAELYDDLVMPPELIKAHQMNDIAVWEAYGKKWDIKSESECVAKLMEMYEKIVSESSI